MIGIRLLAPWAATAQRGEDAFLTRECMLKRTPRYLIRSSSKYLAPWYTYLPVASPGSFLPFDKKLLSSNPPPCYPFCAASHTAPSACYRPCIAACPRLLLCFSEVVLVMKRLVKREAIKVQFELPGGSREYDIKAGSNLRGEMMRLDVPVGHFADQIRSMHLSESFDCLPTCRTLHPRPLTLHCCTQ